MNILLVWPVFPKSYWSFDAIIKLVGKKALMPPLGVITVAGMLPQHWNMRLVDKNVRDLTEADWAMGRRGHAVVDDRAARRFLGHDPRGEVARPARDRGRPYVTSVPEDAEEAGADYIVMDEGEVTIPLMLEEFLQIRHGAVARAKRRAATPRSTRNPR
jgi:radical SAM superfamily enzyme YgiQ (UPF0313 family)